MFFIIESFLPIPCSFLICFLFLEKRSEIKHFYNENTTKLRMVKAGQVTT